MNINKFVKKKNGMYSIFLEDGDVLVVHEDLILKYDLLLTKKISDEGKEKILAENLNYIAYSLAIKYITVRQRSRKEIIKYLSDKNVDKNIIDKTVSLPEYFLESLLYTLSYSFLYMSLSELNERVFKTDSISDLSYPRVHR